MMLADRPDENHDAGGGTDNESAGTSIHGPEIAQIAVFKLRECAARLETLAGTGQGSPLYDELRQIGEQLRDMEVALLRYAREDK